MVVLRFYLLEGSRLALATLILEVKGHVKAKWAKLQYNYLEEV